MEEHSRTTILIQKSEPTIICNTLSRYNIDISAISETHLIGVSQIEEIREGYTIFWPGKDNDESGVRLIIKSDIASLLESLPKAVTYCIMMLTNELANSSSVVFVSV